MAHLQGRVFLGQGAWYPFPCSAKPLPCGDCVPVSLKAMGTDQEMGHRGWVAGPGHTAGEDGARWWPHVLDFAPGLGGAEDPREKHGPRVLPPPPSRLIPFETP